MIYTLTFNPAIDYIITTDKIVEGAVNRTTAEQIHFGGKGINVSLVLKELGVKSTALGFVGGFTGKAIEQHLKSGGIACDFVKIEGNTRINVKINDTDINASGPDISDDALCELYQKLEKLTDKDFLVISGSVPKSLPQNTYKTILERLKHKGIHFVIDAEKDLLVNTLKYKPFLIKPNHHELGAIFDIEISDFETALFYADKLQKQGAQNVLVSMGEMGAVLLDANGNSHTSAAPQGEVISAVGAGDSAVAAFLAEYIKSGDYKKCLKLSVAAGSATAFSDGLATAASIKEICEKI